MEASLGNPFQNGTPTEKANYEKWHGLPRCMAGPHVAVSAHKHAVPPLPPLPPLPPAVAALGSLAASAAAPAAAPAASAAASAAGLVPCQECMMLTISQGAFMPANGLAGLATN